jgi:hypothetical protein
LIVHDDGGEGRPALYAGGSFSGVDVARWDGSTWMTVGNYSSTVNAMCVHDDGSGNGPYLYAAGNGINNASRWDGSTWTSLGTHGISVVYALVGLEPGTPGGPALIAGGYNGPRIAKWDGASWSPMGLQPEDSVRSLLVFNDSRRGEQTLYMGGSFWRVGSQSMRHIAQWNGTAWMNVGDGGGLSDTVRAMALFDVEGQPWLHIGGDFELASWAQVNDIARWNGSNWESLLDGLNSDVYALKEFDNGRDHGPHLYVGGRFTNSAHRKITKWDGTSWSSHSTVLNETITCFEVFDDHSGSGPAMFAGDTGLLKENIDGEWVRIPDGPDGGLVQALAAYDDGSGDGIELYVGGTFDSGRGQVLGITKWNGRTWSPVGFGFAGAVSAMTVHDDGGGGEPLLYVGGSISINGGPPRGIVAWDGVAWREVGPIGGSVLALESWQSDTRSVLYAGGDFTIASGWPGDRLAKLEESQWWPVESGLTGPVRTMLVLGAASDGAHELLIGGDFWTPVGDAYIAKVLDCPVPCIADIVPEGGDGQVTQADINAVISAFGSPCDDCLQDIVPAPQGDNQVTIADIIAVLTAFGPCE